MVKNPARLHGPTWRRRARNPGHLHAGQTSIVTLLQVLVLVLVGAYLATYLVTYLLGPSGGPHKTTSASSRGRQTLTFMFVGQYGRLGNQLFQIASTIGIAEANNMQWDFPPSIASSSAGRLFSIRGGFTKTAHEISHHQEVTEVFYNVSLPAVPSGAISLAGYFQSLQYFDKSLDKVRKVLHEPSRDIQEFVKREVPSITSDKTVALHVRRGDYLALNHVFNVLTPKYYKDALSGFGTVDGIIIVSDDIPWCKENLAHIHENVVFSPFADELHDFVLLYLSRNTIVANSSFSWWAAFLGRLHSGKDGRGAVVAPSPWFNESGPNAYANRREYYPRSWKVLPCT
jgi:hypothetical protein